MREIRPNTPEVLLFRHPSLVDAGLVEAVFARQDPDDLVDAVVLDADGARGAVGGALVQVQIVGLQDGRRDDGQCALRLAAQPSLQPVLGVDVSEHK